MQYEMISSKITQGVNNGDVPSIVIDKLELIPKNYSVAFQENLQTDTQTPIDKEIMKKTIANTITQDLMGNMEHEINPKGLHTYKFSSIVYYKPNEKEICDLLSKEYRLNSDLNAELYDYRVLVKSPWKLFKQFFKSLLNLS